MRWTSHSVWPAIGIGLVSITALAQTPTSQPISPEAKFDAKAAQAACEAFLALERSGDIEQALKYVYLGTKPTDADTEKARGLIAGNVTTIKKAFSIRPESAFGAGNLAVVLVVLEPAGQPDRATVDRHFMLRRDGRWKTVLPGLPSDSEAVDLTEAEKEAAQVALDQSAKAATALETKLKQSPTTQP